MGRKPSARELDMQRRHGRSGKRGTGWAIALVAVAALVMLLVFAAPSDEPAVGRSANVHSFGLADDPYRGDPNASVVLVGYESPHCSSCQYFHSHILPGLDEEYFDTGQVVYYYIQGTIGGDRQSNIAQECAFEHGGNAAFWSLTDRLYGRSNTYATPDWDRWLTELAETHDLDGEALRTCLHDEETSDRVDADLRVGRDNGARGTPMFWAFDQDGQAVSIGSMEDVDSELASLLEQ